MLFGKEEVRNSILEDARIIAAKRDVEIVYGVTLGSLSRGIPSADSDYDVRFLYRKKESQFESAIYEECAEDDIVFRYNVKPDVGDRISLKHYYDKIAFWDLSAFLHCLISPKIGKNTTNPSNLYYVVIHSFMSPYTWDPYGIQPRVMNYIYSNFKVHYVLRAYMQVIDSKFSKTGENVLARGYLTAIWAALSIKWVLKNKMPAPIDFWQLFSCAENKEIYCDAKKWNDTFFEQSLKCIKNMENPYRKASKELVISKRNKLLDSFIEENYSDAQREVEKNNFEANIVNEKMEMKALEEAINRAMNLSDIQGIL